MRHLDTHDLHDLPPWLLNIAALAWRLLVIIVLGLAGWLVVSTLWTVTAAIAVAVLVAAAFAPLVLRQRASGRSRNAAAAIGWLVAMAIMCGVPFLLFLALLPELAAVLQALEAGLVAVQAQAAAIGLPDGVSAAMRNLVGSAVDTTGSTVSDIVAGAAQVVTVLVLAVFLLFFLLRDGDRAWQWLFQATGNEKRELIGKAGDVALGRVGGYLRGMTVLASIVAVTNWLFMWVLGVPLAVSLAIFSFFASFVPYVGGIVATIVILVVSLAALGTGPTVLLFLAMALRSAILSTFVRPAVYSHTMRINPALVLVAIAVGAEVGGIVGLLAAVPLTAAALAVARAAVSIVEPESPRPLPALVPSWVDRLAQVGWRVLVVLGLAGALVAVVVTIPLATTAIVLSLLLAAALAPSVAMLVDRGRSRGRAAAMAVAGVSAVIAGLVVLSFGWLAVHASDVGTTAVEGMQATDDAAGGTLGLLVQAVDASSRDMVATIASALDEIAGIATTLVLSVLLTFFLLRDGPALWRAVLDRVAPSARGDVGLAGTRVVEVLGGYIVGTAAVSLVGAGSQFLIMVTLGIPLAVPVFVLSFILCFIPYIGSFISTGIAFLITVAAGSSADIAIMVVWTAVFNIVQGNVVSPVVYGRTVHLHPAIVLLAIPAGAAVAGILGMFLVVPILGVIAGTWRLVLAAIGDPPPLPSTTEPEPDSASPHGAGAVASA